jgi:putative restriction endonuclease
MSGDPDAAIRAAAFAELQRMVQTSGILPWSAIRQGFRFDGEIVRFASQPVGIFKPRQMSAALSLRTVVPRAGRRIWYRDQQGESDHRSGLVPYDLARGGRENRSNQALLEAVRRRAPLIYFVAAAPGVYEPVWPVWAEEDLDAGRVLLAAADPFHPSLSSVQAAREEAPANELRERSYSLVASKKRNHQAWFSNRTKSAYGHRCAFSGLPLRRLLVGAHILPDAEDGPATVTNGICMSTLHHSAFDAHLLGVDTDCRVHLARSVRDGRDGPLLQSLKGLDGARLRSPLRPEDRPDREFLDWRFQRFLEATE